MTSRAQVWVVVATALGVLSSAACQSPKNQLELVYPDAAAFAQARWVELRIGAGQSCAGMRASTGGASYRYDVHGEGPELGDVARGPVAFLAFVRDAQCQVVLDGCVEVEIRADRDNLVSIPLQRTSGTGCAADQRCLSGWCVMADAGATDAASAEQAHDAAHPDATLADARPLDGATDAATDDHAVSDRGAADAGSGDRAGLDASGYDQGCRPQTVAVAEDTIARWNDDIEELADCTVDRSSHDLEIVDHATNGQQAIGLRFKLDVPAAASVNEAWVQFTVETTATGAAAFEIQAEKTLEASEFVDASCNLSHRPMTTAAVAWNPVDWVASGSAGTASRTPNLAPVFQELVDQPGWLAGNHVALKITGSGLRVAWAYGSASPASAPYLHVEYGAASGPTISTAGLVGEWRLDEASGTVALDSSGLGNDGTLEGAPARISGRVGGAIDLHYQDGIDDVSVANSPSLENVQEYSFTLAAWFHPHSLPLAQDPNHDDDAYAILVKPGHHCGLFYEPSGVFALAQYSAVSDVYDVYGSSVNPPGRWYHVAGVVDRTIGRMALYVDGVLEDEQFFAPGMASYEYDDADWHIGAAMPDADSYCFGADGAIDQASIYRRVLTDSEIRALANEGC